MSKGAKKKSKEIIYDSGKFDWCLDINYPVTINNRYVFFYALPSNYRKQFNRAEYFSKCNKICVLFIYGGIETESIENEIKKRNGCNLVVIHYDSKSFGDLLEAIDTADEYINKYKKRGNVIKEDKVTDDFIKEYENILDKAIGNIDKFDDEWKSYYRNYKSNAEYLFYMCNLKEKLLDRLKELQEKINFDYYFWYKNELNTGTGNLNSLINLLESFIFEIYPCGAEVATSEPYAYKSIAIKRIVQGVLEGKTDSGKLGIDLEKGEPFFAKKIYDDGIAWIESKLRVDGYFEYDELLDFLSFPPYGFMQDNNWYAYILIMIMIKYEDYHMRYINMAHEDSKVPMEWLITQYHHKSRKIKSNTFRRMERIYIFKPTEKYYKTVEMLNELSGYDGTKDNLSLAITFFLKKLEEPVDGKKRLPISIISQQYCDLNEHTYSLSGTNGVAIEPNGWFEQKFVDETYYFLRDNFEFHKQMMVDSNSLVLKKLYQRYPNWKDKVDLWYKHIDKLLPICAVWLWDKDAFLERMDNYMSKLVCKECGDIICQNEDYGVYWKRNDDNDREYLAGYSGDKIWHFSQKDIVALNRKLVDRDMTNYYCVDCLCELLDCTYEDLQNKIEQFKQEGCTLFG